MSHPRRHSRTAFPFKFRPRGYPFFLLCLFVGVSLVVAGGAWLAMQLWSSGMPDVRILRSRYPVPIVIGGATKGRASPQSFVIRWAATRPGSWTSLQSVSPAAVGAIVVSEDWAFFSHKGYDSNQIREALKHDFERGSFARGASTITQQVAKNVFLNQEKSLWRKFREILLAVRLEKELGKRRVLETYLNVVEWGPGIFGIQAASLGYFGKPPSELTAREGAFLAMLLPSPVRYSQSFRQRRLTSYATRTISRILEKMVRAGYLTPEEAEAATAERMGFEGMSPSTEGGEGDVDEEDEDSGAIDPEPAPKET